MTHRIVFEDDHKLVRNILRDVLLRAKQLHRFERELIQLLIAIDQNRVYRSFGHKSLRGFCEHGLGFTKVQSQRIVTIVRRAEPIVDIGILRLPEFCNWKANESNIAGL